MITPDFSEFRNGLKKYLDRVEENNETLIIKRGASKGIVVISLEEYNSIMETVYLLRSKANADHLYDSIQQMKEGRIVIKKLE